MPPQPVNPRRFTLESIRSRTSNAGFKLLRRRARSIPNPPIGKSRNATEVVPPVLRVTVAVCAADEAVKASDVGAIVQEARGGTVPQVNETVPAYPPAGVTVSVDVPLAPAATVMVEVESAAVMLGATIVSVIAFEVEPRKPVPPP